MYEVLTQLVNSGEWEQAEKEFQKYKDIEDSWTDELAILAASIYFHKGLNEPAFDCICRGLRYNYKCYELYLLLGNYYEQKNVNQAWLCYENAELYCDNDEDLDIILQYKDAVEMNSEWNVRNTSIVILSYNLKDITMQCIESIRLNNLPSSYEIVVVDNNSTDGVREWLEEQKDIKLICNFENKGFPYGCNQGIKAAQPENNIFLLNNDTVVTPNSIFWLRMGLYEKEDIGATGSVSNYVMNGQMITQKYNTLEQYISYGIRNNIPRRNPYEKKIYLVGFALMLKRTALDNIGLLDVRFSPGQYEDNDLGIRLNYAGWKVMLCKNSFIFHYGSGGGKYVESWNSISDTNAEKLRTKWNFDIRYYTWARLEIIKLITHEPDRPIKVLEVGCGLGATLAKIKYFWPASEVKGIEIVDSVAKLGANYLDIIQGDIENMKLPYKKNYFDYIILADVIEHLHEPEETIKMLMPYLNEGGMFLCSIPNIMHVSALLPLLQGKFDYMDSGILDRTHLRFFTLDSIYKMCDRCGLVIEDLSSTDGDEMTTQEQQMLDALEKVPGIAPKEMFGVYQYVFRAGRAIGAIKYE